MENNILIAKNIKSELSELLADFSEEKIFVLTDSNTFIHCLPKIENIFKKKPIIKKIPAGEKSKNIESVYSIWEFLIDNKADRNSLLLNLGGGVITDLGGFAASTFKRGIKYINIPTSLLAMVDAAIGGKNGINFKKYKNQIGIFNNADVLIFTKFLETLPQRHLRSGFAEMIKHSLLDSTKTWEKISSVNPQNIDLDYLQILIKESINIKLKIIKSDPFEKGLRKALNFGHTIGHSLETYFSSKNIDILHGEAVAIGLISELFLSNKVFTFNFMKLFEITEYLATYFPSYKINYDDYNEILNIMHQDKKNRNDEIRFSLLERIGKIHINQICSNEDIFQSLNFYYQVKK